MPSRRLQAVALVAVAGLLGAGCAGRQSGPALAVPHIFDLTRDPAAGIVEVKAGRADVLAANRLRLTLEQLLGWHVVTLGEVMRRAQRNDPNLKVWMDALSSNTDDVTAAIGLVYGPVGARAFAQQWASHTQFLLDYAGAVSRHDHGAAALAMSNLADYEHDNGLLLDVATGGHAPAARVEAMLRTHVSQMVAALDASARGDAGTSLQLTVTAHGYGDDIGDALAQAISAQQPTAFPGPLDDPHTLICSLINRQLGSWVVIQAAAAGTQPDRKTANTQRRLRTSTLAALGSATSSLDLGPANWHVLDVNPSSSTPAPDLTGFLAIAQRTGDPAGAVAAGHRLVQALAKLGDKQHHLDEREVDNLDRATHDFGIALSTPAVPPAALPSPAR